MDVISASMASTRPRGDHVVSPLWSTSELTMSDTGTSLLLGVFHFQRAMMWLYIHGQWTDTAVGEVCARHLFLRFLFILQVPLRWPRNQNHPNTTLYTTSQYHSPVIKKLKYQSDTGKSGTLITPDEGWRWSLVGG